MLLDSILSRFRTLRSLEDDIRSYALSVQILRVEEALIENRVRVMSTQEMINAINGDLFSRFQQIIAAQTEIVGRIDLDLEVCIPQLHPHKYPRLMIIYDQLQDERDEIVNDLRDFMASRIELLNIENYANGDDGRWFMLVGGEEE